jgi:hypothetical protein
MYMKLRPCSPSPQISISSLPPNLASFHRGGEVKRRISSNFRDWNIFDGVRIDHPGDGRGESPARSSL